MSRTQKKCLIASGGLHLMLLIILIVAPAFLIKEEEPVDQTVLTLVNTEVAEEAVAQAAPPEPTPPEPTPPKKEEKPREQPKVKKPDPVEPPPIIKKPEPEEKKPEPKPEPKTTPKPKPEPPKRNPIKVDLTEHVEDTKAAQEAARKAEEARKRELAKVFESSKVNVAAAKTDLKPVARVSGGVSYDDYGSTVRSVYMRNWSPPNDIPSKHSTVTVEIVIAKSGTVKSSRIISKSGSAKLDRNISDLINTRVRNIGKPFPAGAKESERTYNIEFNLNLKFNG